VQNAPICDDAGPSRTGQRHEIPRDKPLEAAVRGDAVVAVLIYVAARYEIRAWTRRAHTDHSSKTF
jgi:hypothetical protein